MRVTGDQRFVVPKKHSWNIFEQIVTVAYQISLETNCVEVSFLVKLHDWGLATFFRKQLTALGMVLNTPLSHKLITYYYNADVCKDPNDSKSSRPEVFCKKGVLKNLAKFTGNLYQSTTCTTCTRVSFLISYRPCRPAALFKNVALVQAFSCEFCKISKTPFFIEHLWWLLL